MRVGFLLLSLLVVIAIMLVLYRTEAPAIEKGQEAQQQAQQISGHDANGQAVMNSFKGSQWPLSGQFRGIQITDVTAGGAMDTYYGLKVGDIVLQIGGTDVATLGDYGFAFAQLQEAYQNFQPLTVQRDGNKVGLPIGGAKSPLDSMLGQH